jgi:hypothetical protein
MTSDDSAAPIDNRGRLRLGLSETRVLVAAAIEAHDATCDAHLDACPHGSELAYARVARAPAPR